MDEKNKPLVSVIITTYHNEIYLPRAVDSVLAQRYRQIELIVVDDNQPESRERRNTEEVMKQYPQVVYLKHSENRNGAAARNTGIHASRGKYIAFLDNDDLYFCTHIEKCVRVLEEHPECGAVVCGVVKIRAGVCWEIVYPPDEDMAKALFLSETALGTGSNLFLRADLVRKIGGFDEGFRRHQDVEFGVRAFSQRPVFRIHEVQIVKEMGGYSNMPEFEKFLETKRQFTEKFKDEIAGLTEEEQKRFFVGQYSALLYAACREGNWEQAAWTAGEIRKYRKVNSKEKLLMHLSRYHALGLYEQMKKLVKRGRTGTVYRAVAGDLTWEDRKKLLTVLKG